MIRVNLLKSKVEQVAPEIHYQTDISFGTKSTIKEKLFYLFLPFALIFGFFQYKAYSVKMEINSFEQKSQQALAKLKGMDLDIKEIEKFQAEKRKLDSQVEVIKQLSKERLKNVKSLDAVQNLIPQKAWLSSISIRDNKVQFSGFATDDIVVSEFMQALENSVYFAGVNLVSSEEFKKDAGAIKKFTINCNLENL